MSTNNESTAPEKPPIITKEQLDAIDSLREKVKNLMATVPLDKGGAMQVYIQMTVTEEGRPIVFIETNGSREEAAATVHIARLLLPQLEGMPTNMEQVGAMMAGYDPRTGRRVDSAIIVD
jgi:hypothetical protein